MMLSSKQLSITQSLYPATPLNHDIQEEDNFILPREGVLKEWDQVRYPSAECGKTKYTIKCKDEHHCDHPVELIPWDCKRYECPVCSGGALKQGAVGIREHVWNTCVEIKKAFPGTRWIISSVIISAPREIYDKSYENQHRHLRSSLKHLGTQNVAAIYHRWRYRNTVTGEEFEKIPWKEYKSNPDIYQKTVAPHWHCFVIGKMVKSSEYFKKSGGWVYKKMKSDRDTYSLRLKDLYQIAYYALSHHAISTTRRRHAVHYYGMFWRLTEISKRIDYEPLTCPKCNNQRVQRTDFHEWIAGVNCFGLEVPAVKMIVHRKWSLRGIEYSDLDNGLDFTGIDASIKEVDYVDLENL